MKPKRLLEITLGVITSIGGYLDVGAIATSAQAGASFRFSLLWVIGVGTIALIFLVEMSGRFSAVSKHALRAAMRERLGANFFVWTYFIETIVHILALASQIGGISLALELVTGVSFRWWALPVAVVLWAALWYATFSKIEKTTALLGLITIVFVVGAVKDHPPVGDLARGFIPSLPSHGAASYWFTAVSIIGALVSPYLFYFYSSGTIEDKWDATHIGSNRAIAGIGMGFGSIMAIGVLVGSAMVFYPRGIGVDEYQQVALLLTPSLGRWGFYLFAASLGIACFGACLESALTIAYELAQGLGWNWGESVAPANASRFSTTYTVAIAIAAVPTLLGADPLELTIFTMALTAAILPIVLTPFLTLMNDEEMLGEHINGHLSNYIVLAVSLLASVLAIVTIPLEYFGGGRRMSDISYHVMRELLDNALEDRKGCPMGSVDDLTVEVRPGEWPRITHIEVGGVAMARGLTWPFRPLFTWMARRWGAQRGEPYRIEWWRVRDIEVAIKADVDAEDTPVLHWERVLREHFVRHIPGSQ